jgi:hypothetical protein
MKPHTILAAAALALVPLQGEAQQTPAAPATPAATAAPPAASAPAAQPQAAPQTPAATPVKAEPPPPHVFSVMAGTWSGGGTLTLSSGTRERLRCRAHHAVGRGGKSLSLSIRCASDSYRFELASNVVERRGRIYGRWSEASNGVSGTVSGHAAGHRVRAVARSDSFTAGLAMTTNGNRQSVSITPRGTFITGVHIALRKR